MLKQILSLLRENIYFYIISIFLLSNSIAFISFGRELYITSLFLIAFYAIINHRKTINGGYLYLSFLFICTLSCLFNNVWDIRLLVFFLIIITFTPIVSSYKIFKFREKLLFSLLTLFPFISIVALYCYYAGINMGINLDDGTYHDFSAFFYISISLAAAVGISNVVTTWFLLKNKNKIIKILFLIILISSFFISLVSASRSALFASILAILFMIYIYSKNIKKYIYTLSVILFLSIISMPYYVQYTEKIQNKFENGENKEFGSRTNIWRPSINEFKKTPLIGYGFAVSYTDTGKKVGRVETGSGWLSILFQTGIIGFCCIMLILKKIKIAFKFIRHDNKLALFFSVFIYLCLHSFFEGYILTTMLYMSLLFWLLLGYLHAYPFYNYSAKSYK